MHYFGRFEEKALRAPLLFEGHATGYRQADLIGRGTGSVHTGLSIGELAAGSWLVEVPRPVAASAA